MNATVARISRMTGAPPTASDGELLDAFLAGDQPAFAALVRRHAALVFATCRRVLRHQQDAEDAFQATFLVLARRAADVWPRDAVGSWLFGVAHRVALKARTARSRRTGREHPLVEVASADRPAPDFDLAEVVHRVVSKLPEVYRAAVVACDLEGLSRKEAAERLGWSEGTLSGRLARARDLLARRFRRMGLTLPAGGVVAVFATADTVSATALQTTIELATGTAAGGASATVAALTEGVIRSMAIFKFKAMVAAVFTACAIGFGAFAATGAGSGDGATGQPTPSQAQEPGNPPAPVAAKPAEPPKSPPAKPVTDRDRLQGTWRIVSLTESEKKSSTNPKDPWVIEVSGGTLRMPFLETDRGYKQREYTFAVDEGQTPRTIDLIAKNAPLGRGIYEFTAPATACVKCHAVGERFKIPGQDRLPLCAPAVKKGLEGDSGMRLALSIDGKRPAKFGGDGVIVFELKRPDQQDEERANLVETRKRLAARLAAAVAEEEKRRLEAELKALQVQIDELIVREARRKAEAELRHAEEDLARAQAQVIVAQADAERATVALRLAQDKLADAEKALAASKKPYPGAKVDDFTVHVRTLTAAEKVIRVKATGKESVLEGLVYAADDVSIKSDGVSVWVVRDKIVLPVDLPAITKGGDAKTNYVLKAGDQLFVQVKPMK